MVSNNQKQYIRWQYRTDLRPLKANKYTYQNIVDQETFNSKDILWLTNENKSHDAHEYFTYDTSIYIEQRKNTHAGRLTQT